MNEIDPKERILNAAFEIFGEKGYKSTTIREICKKADVSLALVNYHFRNKQNLYEIIVLSVAEKAFSDNPISDYISDDMPPEEKLRNMIRLLTHRLIGPKGLGNNPAAVRLIAKELTNPTEVMDKLFANHLGDMIYHLTSIIKELMGDMPQLDYLRFASSIAGQCLHPLFAKEILVRSGFDIGNTYEEIEKHAEHIYRFSMYGINDYKRNI